jgi:Spy/CpxP family protein refolding chaperone
MVTRRITSLLILLSVLVLSSNFVLAQKRAGRLEKLRNDLALTETQLSQVKGALKKHQVAALPLRQQLRGRNQALREALNLPEPETSVIGQIILAKHSLRQQLRRLTLKTRSEIASGLSVEQRQRFKQLRLFRERRFSRG